MAQRRLRLPVPRPLAALALAGALGLGGAGAVLAADHAVAISGFSFSPRNLTIAAGDTVTWTNSDAQAHTATADDDAWDSGTLTNGNSETLTFATAGTFPYHCTIHPEMTGTITVQAATGGPSAAPTITPTDTAVEPAEPGGPIRAVVGLGLAGGLVALVALSVRERRLRVRD